MQTVKWIAAVILLVLLNNATYSQQLRLGNVSHGFTKSAVLELQSEKQGLLFPRIADTALINALNPPDGMVIYHTSLKQLLVRSNGYWNRMMTSVDTTNISNFFRKVRSLFTAGTGISYDVNTGVIASTVSTSNLWSCTGNTGITQGANFLGNIDDKSMIFKSNNQSFLEFGRRQTLGLTQGYTDYHNNDEKVTYIRSALQFEADAAQFYKPKMFTDANGNFRIKGSSAGTDYFEFGSTGSNNNGGFEFIIGDDGDEPILFKSYHHINGMSEIMRLQSGRMAVGSNAFDATNPEKLLIDAGVTNSYNLMTGKGSIDNYLQINVQNRSAGGNASSDLVATANNGSETTNYIDMGINGGGFTNTSLPMVSGPNNAYLYSTGNDFVLGNATAAKALRLFTGGMALTNERMRIDGNGNVGIATQAPAATMDVSGTFKLGTSGSVLNSIIKGTISITDNGGFGQGTTKVISTTVTGATVNGAVIITPRSAMTGGISIAYARVSAANTVTIGFSNTALLGSALGSVTFDVTIIQ